MGSTHSHFALGRLLLQNNCKISGEGKHIRLICNASHAEQKVKPPRSRRRNMPIEKRVEAVEAFVQLYMRLNSGKFPTGSLVRKEVGGSPGTLKEILAKLKTTPKTSSQDQKQNITGNREAFGEAAFAASECLATDAKLTEAINMKSKQLKQDLPLNFNKLSGMDMPNNQKLSSSQFSKEDPVALSVAAESLLTTVSTALAGEKAKNSRHKEIESLVAPSYRKGLSGMDLPEERPSPKYLKEEGLLAMDLPEEQPSSQYLKEEGVALSFPVGNLSTASSKELAEEKVEKSTHKEEDSFVVDLYSEGLSAASTVPEKLEVEQTTGGLSVAAENLCASSTELPGGKVELETNAHKEVVSFVVPSNPSGLSTASTLPKKQEVEQTTGRVTTLHARDAIRSSKVEVSNVKRGSDILQNAQGETNSDASVLERIKQLGQDRRNRRFPLTSSFLSCSSSDDDKEDDSDFAAFDYPEPDNRDQHTIPRTNLRLNMLRSSEKPKDQYCLFVMFLPSSATEHDLRMAFSDCGSITDARIIRSRREDSRFNYASLNFKTEEGFRKVLMKKDIVISGGDVVVEAASPSNQSLRLELTPKAVENTALPLTEIKNPRCTVMIKDLPNGVNFKHLKNSLAFCGTISSFSMGTSNSILYIEFETEDAKEKALMTHWVSVNGHQLQIGRIDAPRTTVVRISNVSPETGDTKVLNICESFGRVKRVNRRYTDIVDVHFRQTELGSMLNILDRLNGVIMNQCRWQAAPAPVFPPETLQFLWRSASGKEYLHSVMQNLCRIIGKNCVDTNDVYELAAQYYGEPISGTKELF